MLLDKIIADYKTHPKANSYTKLDFLNNNPILNRDIPKSIVHNVKIICEPSNIYLSAAGKLLNAKRSTNAIIYPGMSCMDWHTNSDVEGTRVYYTKTTGEAIFSYIKDGVRYNDYDNIGEWTCRSFKIEKENTTWHAVWTEHHRYAFGFNT
jgi:hypothetical protein